jgi:hypothetical protein
MTRRTNSRLVAESLERRTLMAADVAGLGATMETEFDDPGAAAQEVAQPQNDVAIDLVWLCGNPHLVPAAGDFNWDGAVDATDIDALGAAIRDPDHALGFDLDGSGTVDHADMDTLIHEILQTNYGDANLDGFVDALDGIAVQGNLFSPGSGWSSGDFNTDGVVDSLDLLLWQQNQQLVPRPGDFNRDGAVDANDIDALGAAIGDSSTAVEFDLDGNGTVDQADMNTMIHDVLQTNYGDANLDGVVDGTDYLALRDNIFSEASGWSNGDFNADGVVDGLDYLLWRDNQELVPITGNHPVKGSYPRT